MLFPAVDTHSVLKAAIMVQATTTAMLVLLRFADRRTRGMGWLAATSAFSVLAMLARMPHASELGARWDVPVAAGYSMCALCAYFGLRWFSVRKSIHSWWWPALAVAIILLGMTQIVSHPVLALTLIRLTTLSTLITLVLMLWRTPEGPLRPIMRIAGAVLSVILLIPAAMIGLSAYGVGSYHNSLFSRVAVVFIITAIDFLFVAAYVAESKRRHHEETRRDVLTGLHNRLAMEECAEKELRSAGPNHPLSLLMLDLDHFKALNDTWGHALGDRALRAVGDTLQTVAGNEASCMARLGGEEFAVLLSHCTEERATGIAENIRAAIEALRLPEGNGVATLTVSIGVSSLHSGESDWTSMLRRADVALYQAKGDGRNRIVLCSENPPTHEEMVNQTSSIWRKIFNRNGTLV